MEPLSAKKLDAPHCDVELLGFDNHELVYFPGSAIEGNVVIELTTPLRPIQGINIVLGGIVFTN